MLARRGQPLLFTKIKGHAKEKLVRSGKVRRIDNNGNDHADALAVRGANTHAIPQEIVMAATARKQLAVRTHKCMLDVLNTRKMAE